jgi:hypothetical protein
MSIAYEALPSAKGHNTMGMGDPTLQHRYPYIDDIVPKTVCSRKAVCDLRPLLGVCLEFRSEPSRSVIPLNAESHGCAVSRISAV